MGTPVNGALSTLVHPLRRPLTHRESIALVFFCTLIGAGAQVFMKTGAHNLPNVGAGALIANPLIILRNYALLAGLSLYGVFTLLLVFALRDAELSVIYPVIALTYVWVTFLSLIFFQETMNPLKGAGIAIIVIGVMILGKGGGRR